MPLSPRLLQVDLTLECKYCGYSKTKTGQWFRVAHRFMCVGCKREVAIGYSDKVALFKKHAQLLGMQAEVVAAHRITFAPSQMRR